MDNGWILKVPTPSEKLIGITLITLSFVVDGKKFLKCSVQAGYNEKFLADLKGNWVLSQTLEVRVSFRSGGIKLLILIIQSKFMH